VKNLLAFLAFIFVAAGLFAQDQAKMLYKAYNRESKTRLNTFFYRWHSEIPTISDSEFAKLPDIEKETYKVFTAFYHPENDSAYHDVSFLIVQNSIKIYTTDHICVDYNDSDSATVKFIVNNDTLIEARKNIFLKRQKNGHLNQWVMDWLDTLPNGRSSFCGELKNFRPRIECDGKIPLYLNQQYENLMFIFFNYFPESNYRTDFFKGFVTWNLNDHISSPWFISYPILKSVTFDKTKTKATIEAEFNNRIDLIIMKIDNGKWHAISSKTNWEIERSSIIEY